MVEDGEDITETDPSEWKRKAQDPYPEDPYNPDPYQ